MDNCFELKTLLYIKNLGDTFPCYISYYLLVGKRVPKGFD